eukprot:g3992.t1
MLWILAVSILLLLGVYLLLTPPQEDDDFDEPLPSAPMPTPIPAAASSASSAPAGKQGGPDSCPAGPITIYFGSQTGTAEGFGKTLAQDAARHGFDATVADLEDFEFEDLAQQRLALFVVATYGEGEPTDNAVRFLRVLKNADDEIEEGALAALQYSTFGLGNRQYEHYNKMGRDVHKMVGALGAQEAFAYGEGDDDADLEDDFEAWKEGLWPALVAKFHPEGAKKLAAGAGARVGGAALAETSAPRLTHTVEMLGAGEGAEPDEAAAAQAAQAQAAAYDAASLTGSAPYFAAVAARVTANRELRQSTEDGSTRHLEIDVSGAEAAPLARYRTADNLAILPENPPAAVHAVAKALGLSLESRFRLAAVDAFSKTLPPFPTPCTVREALSRYCDLSGLPRKGVLMALAHFAGDAKEKERLLLLASKHGKAEYAAWVADAGRTLAEVITAFPSVKPSLEQFIAIAPRLMPRYFTISSSSAAHPTSIHVTVSVLVEPKTGGRVVKGVCSNYLAGLAAGKHRLRAFVRASSFRLPSSRATPILMIGPGTGIAPMRAFLQERAVQRAAAKESNEEVGDSVLFFGCRHREKDFIYEDELLAHAREGALTALETAFSREQAQKVYVQDVLRQKAEMVRSLVGDKGAHVYVCGATRMGTDVLQAVGEILGSEAAAKKLQADGRYVQELWS